VKNLRGGEEHFSLSPSLLVQYGRSLGKLRDTDTELQRSKRSNTKR